MRTDYPEDDDYTIYLDSGCNVTFKDIQDAIEEKWPNVDRELITISSEHRHVKCLGYDQYDSSDYNDYLVVHYGGGAAR